MQIEIRSYKPEYISQMIDVQTEYQKKYPNYAIRGEEVYTNHPGFENRQNILCAFNSEGKLLAYAPLLPAPVKAESSQEHQHYIWTDMIYNPKVEELETVENELFNRMIKRANEIKATFPERATRLASAKYSDEEEGIRYFLAKGFELYESLYVMKRDLSKPIPELPKPEHICVKKWKIESDIDKDNYVRVDNLSNPNSPITLEKLDWFLNNLWKVGTPIGAFNESDELVGNVMTFWFSSEDAVTEEIFVLPEYRGKGIAQYMVKEALCYLRECGKTKAELEVRKSNTNAVNLYKKLGYEIDKVECSLGIYL